MIKVRVETDILEGIRSLIEANTSLVEQSLKDCGSIPRMELRANFFLNKEDSEIFLKNLRDISVGTVWTYSNIVQQFQKNMPTDFAKWAVNITRDINISGSIGYSDYIIPSWMKKTKALKEYYKIR